MRTPGGAPVNELRLWRRYDALAGAHTIHNVSAEYPFGGQL